MLHPPGSSIPICTCPPGYQGNGYGPTGCSQTSNICQSNNPCVNGQCVVSFVFYLKKRRSFRIRFCTIKNPTLPYDPIKKTLAFDGSPPPGLLATLAPVTLDGKDSTVTRTSTSVWAIPVRTEETALMQSTDSPAPAPTSGPVPFARPNAKVCGSAVTRRTLTNVVVPRSELLTCSRSLWRFLERWSWHLQFSQQPWSWSVRSWGQLCLGDSHRF